MRAFPHYKFTRLNSFATLSVAALLGVILWQVSAPWRTIATTAPNEPEVVAYSALWQQEMMLLGLATSTEPGASDGTDPIALIGPQVLAQIAGKYSALVESGEYSEEAAAAAAAEIAPNVRAFVGFIPYTRASVKTDADVSYERMLTYREAMQEALKPLLTNTRAEYEIYGSYIETRDVEELEELKRVAKNYADAAAAMMRIAVPADATETHLAIANALAHFSATLSSMAEHADDSVGSLALLRTYNDTELAVVLSFDKLAEYGRSKMP